MYFHLIQPGCELLRALGKTPLPLFRSGWTLKIRSESCVKHHENSYVITLTDIMQIDSTGWHNKL